jgi:SAM-dependent methyltransferase
MHQAQKIFCKSVKKKHPKYFKRQNVLDVGSLDVNGNNRYLFSKCNYVGIDIAPRSTNETHNNVDLSYSCIGFFTTLSNADRNWYNIPHYFDMIISTEMLEHSKSWRSDVGLMLRGLKPGGLLLITAAGEGREEHGTAGHKPIDSPMTLDHYENISIEHLSIALPAWKFNEYYMEYNAVAKDIYFYGIKK